MTRMDMATLLKHLANLLVGVSVVKWVAADLKAEIRHDAGSVRDRANAAAHNSPYGALGMAAAAGALAGFMLGQRRRARNIPRS